MSHFNDWLQVYAGVFAAVGFVLLSVGLLDNDEEKGAKVVRPVLSGIGVAIVAANISQSLTTLGDTYFSTIMIRSTTRDLTGTIADILLGFGFGYLIGYLAQNIPSRQRHPRRIWTQFVIILVAIGIVGVVGVAILKPTSGYSDEISTSGSLFELLLSFGLMQFSVTATPRFLKLLGFFVTLFGVFLAILPPLYSILGVSIQ